MVLEEPSNSFSLPGLQCPDCPLRNYPVHRESRQWDCQDTLPFPSRGMNPKPRQTPDGQSSPESGRVESTRQLPHSGRGSLSRLLPSACREQLWSSVCLPPSPAPPPFFFLSSLALGSPPACDSISAHQTLLNTNQPGSVAFARESTNTPSLNVD